MTFFKKFLLVATIANLSLPVLTQKAENPASCDNKQDDGKYANDLDGYSYKIGCNLKISGKEYRWTNAYNFQACFEICGEDGTKCTGVNYGPGRRCNFFDNGQKGTITDPSVSSAWRENEPAPPPPKPSPDPSPKPSPKPNPGTPSDADTVTEPKCPDDDDKHYVGPDGSWYKIQCKHHAPGNPVNSTLTNTFEQCLDQCSAQTNCVSAHWMYDPPASGYKANDCTMSDGEGPGTRTCEHWFAYTVPPPGDSDGDNFPYTLCETACPVSHGMIYESENGESFRMACGTRNDHKIIGTQPAESFDDCMDICGKVLPCHSVNYHQRTQKCYLSSPHGEGKIAASGFQSATSVGCAGACKKKSGCCGKDEL